MTTFVTAMADANKTKNAALSSAKTNADRQAAMDAFRVAVAAANEARTTALNLLITQLTPPTTTVPTVKP